MNALDKSIVDLCERHNLASVDLCLMRLETRLIFQGCIQWIDHSKPHGRGVAIHSADTFAEALNGAVAKMAAQRTMIELPTDAVDLAA